MQPMKTATPNFPDHRSKFQVIIILVQLNPWRKYEVEDLAVLQMKDFLNDTIKLQPYSHLFCSFGFGIWEADFSTSCSSLSPPTDMY